MRRSYSFIITICITICCITACKSTKEPTKTQVTTQQQPEPQKEVKEEFSLKDIQNANIKTLSANFSTEVEGIGVSGQIRVKKDNIIWVSISKLIELARIKFTPDSIYVNVKVKRQAFQGTYEQFKNDYKMLFSFEIAQALFLGNELTNYNTKDYTLKNNTDNYEFSFLERKSTKKLPTLANYLKVDKNNKKIVYNKMQSTNPNQIIEIAYSDFTPIANNRIANKLKVSATTRATGKVTVDINLEDIKINQDLSYPMNISKRASKLNF